MSRLLSIIMLMMLALNVSAGSFDKLWKEYEKAVEADLPKSAIEVLHNIQTTAEKKKSYGDLLKALILEQSQWGEISADSVKSYKARLLAWQKAKANPTNGKASGTDAANNRILATLLQTVLHTEQGAPKVDSLITSPDAGIYTKAGGGLTYKPFTEQGVDSKYFNDDLLSIIAMHTGQYKALQHYYASTSNRQGACIAAALCLDNGGFGGPMLQQCDSLINIYGDLQECGALAYRKATAFNKDSIAREIAWIDEALQRWPTWKEMNTLRNMRTELVRPQCSLSGLYEVTTTDTDVKIHLYNVRNIKKLNVTLLHYDANGKQDQQRTFEHALPWKDEYSWFKDTVSLGRLPLGKWKIMLSGEDGLKLNQDIDIDVTDLKILAITLPKKQVRYVVVNAISGQPVPDATISIKKGTGRRNSTGDGNAQITTGKVNTKGEYMFTSDGSDSYTVKATTANDYAMPYLKIWGTFSDGGKSKALEKREYIYTDRAIYRPGQTMHIAVVSYSIKDGKETVANKNEKITIAIRDASGKVQKEIVAVTDDFGTATADFSIPEDCRTGFCLLRTDKGNHTVQVEEYKRPKFVVNIEKPTTSYKAGDTVSVHGTAKTYSGMPVANAKVVYHVQRNFAFWWRRGNEYNNKILNDTIYTDADGTFTMRVPMQMPKNYDMRMPLFYSISATATVTDLNGESHSEEVALPLSNRETYLSFDIKKTVLADSVINITFKRQNAAGNDIDGTVKVTIDGKPQADAKANKRYALAKSIASGKHTIVGICEGDTVTNEFVAFRKNDKTPMTYTHHWEYASAGEWKNNNDEVWIQVGSSDENVHVVYNVFANDSVIEQGDTMLNCSNITRSFRYKPEYGDGIEVVYAWVKNGEWYKTMIRIYKALPDKKLKMEWSTFRDKLIPGQKEQWSVRIKNPDGTAAKAQLMAVLYDKSLDQLSKLSWRFYDGRTRHLCSPSCSSTSYSPIYRRMDKEAKNLDITDMEFSRIAVDFYGIYNGNRYFVTDMVGASPMKKGSGLMMLSAAKVAAAEPMSDKVFDCVETSASDNRIGARAGDIRIRGNSTVEDISPRSDFSETALWAPQVIADSKGIATLRFTMPESVTTWHFKAFAHDKEMRYGFMEDEAVTQKQLMIEPNMPRFLRINDKATISANVGNLSDKAQNVKVTMTVLDPSTERVLSTLYNNVRIEAGKSTSVTFPLQCSDILGKAATSINDTSFIVKFMASGANFSDGEQHLLPILTDKEEVVDTTAFVVDPKKMIAEALPQLAVPTSNNAITLSNAYYANVMAAHLSSNAEITGNSGQSDKSAGTVSPANDNVLAQLINLQKADGGFSWYSGMESSRYMTVAVLKTLARVNAICGVQPNTEFLMSKAFAYMEKEMEREMKYQKEHKYSYLSGTTLDWLYALTLDEETHKNTSPWGRKGGATYFRKMLYDQTRKDDMQSKAVAGIVMNNNHQTKKAQEFAEAIKQHTVYRSDMGRYFDSYRAEYSWCDYKIPTHSMCIEALNDITPLDTATITEMQRWLVQSKRTQRWDNAINAVNAIYALSLSSAQKPFMAKYTVHPQDLQGAITVKREIIGNSRNVGDKVKVRLTIVADRDYDFVTVTDNRAACLEPTVQMSGYHWGGFGSGGNGYYQEMKDQKAVYHFDQFHKGTHVIETEYYIDRKGNYTSGKATAVCEYAPEFRGTAEEYNIAIK